jgi:hypothetical protein
MSNETNQDQQTPTKDVPPPKQYATQHEGQPSEHGTDERRPKVPDHIETSGGSQTGDKRLTSPAVGSGTKDSPKQGGQGGQERGSRSDQSSSSDSTGGRGGSGSGSNAPSGGRSGKP